MQTCIDPLAELQIDVKKKRFDVRSLPFAAEFIHRISIN
jgi:hypothetical protein